MLKRSYVLMNEEPGDEGFGAGGEYEGFGPPEGEGEGLDAEPESAWLRDIDEETGYNTLKAAQQFPDHLRGLESRVYGKFGPLVERLNSLEKSLGTQVSLDTDKIAAALDKYDGSGSLKEALLPALQEAFQVNQLDESALRPYLEPVQQSMREQMGEALVLSRYDVDEIQDMIPDVVDGKFVPQTARQKDFASWYAQQDYATQQSLNEFGPAYLRALSKFENWEKGKTKERTEQAGDKSSRLARGQQPSSRGRRPAPAGPQTAEEAFLAGFNSVD